MIERYFLIFWAVWLLLILIAAFRVMGFSAARRWQDRKWKDLTRNQQSTALIIAVKGFDLLATPKFFDSIFSQDYRDYRVVVTFESWDDPVAIWLKGELDLNESDTVWNHPEPESCLKSITLVCAGIAQVEGQKVHNQIAAFRELNDRDHVIAFADSDIVCGDDWLARLLAPINLGTHPLSTTYRWLVPKRPTLPNQLASVINGSITTQGGSELTNVLWGGSMALTRKVFDQIKVPMLLSGSVNDDLRLSKAARRAGNRIAFVRSLVIPTLIDFNWGSFLEFAKRQYTQVKFFSPILYAGTNIVLGFYALGVLSLLGALIYGYFYAWIPIAAAYIIDQFRGLARQQVYLSLFPQNEIRRKLFAACWLEHMLTPVWMLLHWFIIMSTWTQNRIVWAGVHYRIISKSKTRILARPTTVDTLPVSTPGLALIAALHDKKRGTYTPPILPAVTTMAASVVDDVATAEPAAVLVSPSPTSVGPFSHPGVSSYVTRLSSAPRFEDLRDDGYVHHFILASRQNPILFQACVTRVDQATMTRYRPLIQITKATEPASPRKPKRSVPLLSEAALPGIAKIPRAAAGLAAPSRDTPEPLVSRHAPRAGLTRIEQRLSRTRQRSFRRFPTNPGLACSAAPSAPCPIVSQPITKGHRHSPALNSPHSLLTRSLASRRTAGSRRHRHVGNVSRKAALSTRASHVGPAMRGAGRNRPISQRASGRRI